MQKKILHILLYRMDIAIALEAVARANYKNFGYLIQFLESEQGAENTDVIEILLIHHKERL